MRIWDCPSFDERTMLGKLESMLDKCYFVGYPKEIIGYNSYHPLKPSICFKVCIFLRERVSSRKIVGVGLNLEKLNHHKIKIN